MTSSRRGRLSAWGRNTGLFGVVTATSIASVAAVTLKPKVFPLKVLGIQVDIPVSGNFDMKSEGETVAVQLSAQASLKDLQNKALQIARAIPVPRGNCDREGVNPVVNSIDEASISPSADMAVVSIKGQVTAWLCTKRLGFTAKTETAHDSVSVTAKVRVAILNNGKALGLQLVEPVEVATGNALTGEVVRLFAGDINASITNALNNALDADQARAKLPELPGLDGTITEAGFAADGDTLLVRAKGNATMTGDAFNNLLDTLNK